MVNRVWHLLERGNRTSSIFCKMGQTRPLFNHLRFGIILQLYVRSSLSIKVFRGLFTHFCTKFASYSTHSMGHSCAVTSVTRLDDFLNMGNFLKPLVTINLPKFLSFLGNFCKGVKNYHFRQLS